MKARVHLLVSGRVQGVSFRWSCAERAGAEGVAGWVRNLADGRVEAVFEGPSEAVAAMVSWCRRGPPGAAVTDVEERREELAGEREFHVARSAESPVTRP